jgi:hypothetical protein
MTKAIRTEKGLGPKDGSAVFIEKDHRSGPNTSPNSSLAVDLTGSSKTGWVVVKVKLPAKLYEELKDIIAYSGLWKNLSEFIRFSLLVARDQRIDEMRRTKGGLEERT